MLTASQDEEIREHLMAAQNPIFFFDNDLDGLCSFLLFQRYIGKGKGVAIKTFPYLDIGYYRKVTELKADYIFILDKPLVSKEFLEQVEQVNIPVVWIDHHEINEVVPEFVNYYNPILGKEKTNEPVTALCYKITQKKDDIWLAVMGCVADAFFPKFYNEFKEKWDDLAIDTKDPFDVLYKSRLGKIARVVSNGLKDKTSNVVQMLRFLIKTKSPYDILEEGPKTRTMHYRSAQIEKKYQALLERAQEDTDGKIIFFKYSGDLSISGELSNEIKYLCPNKIIVVAYIKGSKVNISLRGVNIKEKFLKAIENMEGAIGGGHRDAVGGILRADTLDEFKKRLEEVVGV